MLSAVVAGQARCGGVVSRAKRHSAYAEKIVIPALAGIQV